MFCRGFGGYGYGPSGLMFFGMGIKILIFIGILVFAFRLLKNYTNKSNNAIRILDEKFAKGEISEEEYLKRKTILTQNN